MKIRTTKTFEKGYADLPEEIKDKIDKKLELFLTNPQHHSLRVKKMQGYPDIWEASINMNYRFTFQINGDVYILRKIGTYDVLGRP